MEAKEIPKELNIQFSRHDKTLGADVFVFNGIANCAVRQIDPTPPKLQHAADTPEQEKLSIVPDVVRQRWRFLSAIKAWPHSGYYEPQLVDYTANDYCHGDCFRRRQSGHQLCFAEIVVL